MGDSAWPPVLCASSQCQLSDWIVVLKTETQAQVPILGVLFYLLTADARDNWKRLLGA